MNQTTYSFKIKKTMSGGIFYLVVEMLLSNSHAGPKTDTVLLNKRLSKRSFRSGGPPRLVRKRREF